MILVPFNKNPHLVSVYVHKKTEIRLTSRPSEKEYYRVKDVHLSWLIIVCAKTYPSTSFKKPMVINRCYIH